MKLRKLILVLIILAMLPSTAMAEISSDSRLLQRPEWDGAVVSNHWFNGEFRLQHYDDDSDIDFWLISPTYATRLPQVKNLELGGRLSLLHASYDDFESEFGLGDIDIWGKYQFLNNGPLRLSGGALITLPTGAESIVHPRATGEVNFEVFCAGRYQASNLLSFISHVGFRINSDADVELESKSSGRTFRGEVDGETQFMFGGGVIVQLTNALNLLAELNYASEAYDNADSDFEVTGGLEYQIQPKTAIKGGIGIGFDDGAPDYELIIGIARTF